MCKEYAAPLDGGREAGYPMLVLYGGPDGGNSLARGDHAQEFPGQAFEGISSICPCVYAGRNCFPSSSSKSFPRCALTDGCKGVDYGFNVGALLQGWRLWFQWRRVVLRVRARV